MMEIELRSFGNSISFVRLRNSVCQVLKNTPTQIRILSKIRKIRTEANLRKLSGFQLNHASLQWKKKPHCKLLQTENLPEVREMVWPKMRMKTTTV